MWAGVKDEEAAVGVGLVGVGLVGFIVSNIGLGKLHKRRALEGLGL